MGRATIVAGLAAAGALSLPASTTGEERANDGAPPSLLLVTVDTLRRDDARSMASYRRLADRGVEFTDALTTSSWTLPAVASLMTGADAVEHGAVRLDRDWPSFGAVADGLPTLAESLNDLFATVEVVA